MGEVYEGESLAESSRAPKVNQLDADELDDALVSMLGEKVLRSIDNFKSRASWDFKPEIELVIKLVIFRLGICDSLSRSSPGAKLQNLKLIHHSQLGIETIRSALLLYLLFHPPIFPSYLLKRIRQHALSKQWPDFPNHDWRKKAWKALGRVELASKIWEAFGWAGFLWDGKYPSLLMRLLGLRMVPSQPHLTKLVSYEFMNRQLVWSAFTEFLMFAIPLLPTVPPSLRLSPSRFFRPITTFLSQPTDIDYSSLPTIPLDRRGLNCGDDQPRKHGGPLAYLPKTTCPICYIRLSAAPVPLSSTSQGSSLTLPPIPGSSEAAFGHEASVADGEEECGIFMPARTDCHGGCLWCYYCIGEELYRHRKANLQKIYKRNKQMRNGRQELEKTDEEVTWNCLRCGDGVNKAWRADPQDEAQLLYG
ncbi:peroxin-2 [Cryptococcus neoformans Bt85]|nr:peroxin-2 [Cryptococcus neoformans var. grubii Bt85]